jgi:signal transduction histidine kinase
MVAIVLAVSLVACGLTCALLLARARKQRGAAAAAAGECEHLRLDLERCRQLLGQRDRLSAIGMLAASVAHEIRNPLVSVRTFAQLLPERLQDEEFCTSFRELALGEIDRISLLVNDLLSFARPPRPEVHAADINDILGQIRRLVDGETKKRGIALTADLDGSLPPVPVDDARVKQVFLNMVLNALQACDGGGAVTLTTRRVHASGKTYLAVEVRDSGRGIPASEVGRIFDPFFTTKEGGSGLGLFIARRIVAEHGGFIEVRSAPGEGTTFQVNFPLTAAEATGPGGRPTMVATDANDRRHRSVQHG